MSDHDGRQQAINLIDLSPASLLAGRSVGSAVTVLGSPLVVPCGDAVRDCVTGGGAAVGSGPVVKFDGGADAAADGIILDSVSRLSNLPSFAVVAHIRPRAGGAAEQRFFHIQDSASADRFLMEIRVVDGAEWYADTYFRFGEREIVLQNALLRHPCDCWAEYRVEYDGDELRQIVGGSLEIAAPFGGARLPECPAVSLGIRGTREFPFSGSIGRLVVSSSS